MNPALLARLERLHAEATAECEKSKPCTVNCWCGDGVCVLRYRITGRMFQLDVSQLGDLLRAARERDALAQVQLGREPRTINETRSFLATFPAGRQILRHAEHAIEDANAARADLVRVTAERNEAVRLLHMLDRPDARHPDVAAFLDAIDHMVGK